MSRRAVAAVVPLLVVSVFCGAAVAGERLAAATLSFEQRVEAQRAIEHVYYRHQIGATKPFEEALPLSVLETKVQRYLDQTAALEVYWKTRVTDEMLERELERMTRGTRLPERLQELFAALGDDPFLIKECLARAMLVDRLTRNFYAFDTTLHAEARARAEELHEQLASGALDPWSDHPDRSVVDLDLREPSDGEPEEMERQDNIVDPDRLARRELAPDEFRKERAGLPEAPGSVSAIAEEREAFVIRVLLSEAPDEIRAASYVVPKTSWDLWWKTAKKDLRSDRVAAVASDGGVLAIAPSRTSGASAVEGASAEWDADALRGKRSCAADDTWDSDGWIGFEAARRLHTAVWTGSVMIVWGGVGVNGRQFSTGARYEPATDTWTATSTVGAPSARYRPTAVWTGSEMVVWGGYTLSNLNHDLDTGGRYDPVTDTWSATSIVGAPSARWGHTAAWTGRVMLVWGGLSDNSSPHDLDTGGRYDPVDDTWAPTATVGAPSARGLHTVVWTGSDMVVWGGLSCDISECLSLDTGGRYDPVDDTWAPTSTVDVPSGRVLHTAVWTGSEMVVWGGEGYDGSTHYFDTGGRYDPESDIWTPTSTASAPAERSEHTVVWTGSEMVVWGGDGYDGSVHYFDTGGRYDPESDTWTAMSTVGAPSARYQHTAVWTGSEMVVWGGYVGGIFSHLIDTGGRYDPESDSWTPTSTAWAPSARLGHTAVWTGSVMVLWGGTVDFPDFALNTGGRYDPATDAWTATSTVDAPSRRLFHAAFWTGHAMLVWGGTPGGSGGRYDPSTDTWMPMSTLGDVGNGAAVWTGSLMVVWRGDDNTGGRYDPLADTWTAMSTVGAPSARFQQAAVWTGSEMVVWGGLSCDISECLSLDTGGRYDPAADTWTATSTEGAPSGRDGPTAVWTGSEMVVWGGESFDGGDSVLVDTGGRYDPATDTWAATSTEGAPFARYQHTAVWTGSEMVVWGGTTNTGGRYDPAMDSWTAMSTEGAPYGDQYHTAVWTGNAMVVWGGIVSPGVSGTGARYIVVNTKDDDGDGYKVCDGDCDDANPAVYPGAKERCNGLDDDCDGTADDDVRPESCYEGPPGTLGMGVCREGKRQCNDGAWSACQGQVLPSEEVCTNDLDEDCDGTVDGGCVADADGDGFLDESDTCPQSILTPTVVFESCDSGVPNALSAGGCTIADRLAMCFAKRNLPRPAGEQCVRRTLDLLKRQGAITERQRNAIFECYRQSSDDDEHGDED